MGHQVLPEEEAQVLGLHKYSVLDLVYPHLWKKSSRQTFKAEILYKQAKHTLCVVTISYLNIFKLLKSSIGR